MSKYIDADHLKVDLEKYIENEINHYGLSLYEASYGTFSASQIDRIIRNAFELGIDAMKEQKKEWSEEDEHRRGDAIYFLESAMKHYADTSEIEKTISWLKSIRPRLITWKGKSKN